MHPNIRIGNSRARGAYFPRVLFCLAVVVVVLASIAMVTGFSFGTAAINADWKAAMTNAQCSPEQMRGLLDSMIRYSEDPPRVLPPSAYDDEMCAAATVNIVNLVIGQERLKVAPAWFFAQKNRDALEMVFERESDFEVRGDRVVEKKDRALWYSSKMRMTDGLVKTVRDLYIIGYYYRETRSARRIIDGRAQGGTLNSHLMLALGRRNGAWWGYHFIHDPENSERNAFRIDRLGEEMVSDFDLIYIWRIKNTEMPAQGEQLRFDNHAPSYDKALPWIGWWWNGNVEYALDTALTWWRFNRGLTWEVFPRAVTTSGFGLVEIKPAKNRGHHGQLLGFLNGVAVYQHLRESQERTGYGQAYQCVEFVNRYYSERFGHRNLSGSGHANSYFWNAESKGLRRFENGSPNPPQQDDILVFDQKPDDGNPGHIGVVYRVDRSRGKVCLAQQNMDRWHGCLRLERRGNGWHVGSINKDLPCVGWARKETSR